ncbi:MAG: hypothetical protein QM532_02910 [Cyanobium sp. MAG06]|nr:hypothetical protein [Cyanobium sp. MAG06]
MQGLWVIAFVLQYFNIYTFARLESWNFLLVENSSIINNIISKSVYFLSFMEHSFLMPICIYVIYKVGIAKNIYKYLISIIALYLTLSFLISPNNFNLNCMKHSCDTITKDLI